MKTDRANEKKTISEVYELYKLEQKYKDIKKKYEDKKKRLTTSIRNYMFVNGFNTFQYQNNDKLVDVKSVTQKKIIWDVEKLEQKLDKEILNEIEEKTYTINNMEGLIKYLKSCGVNPKKFKSFVNVEKKIDQKKFNELSEMGDISLDDVKGCYELKESEGYVKINIKGMS